MQDRSFQIKNALEKMIYNQRSTEFQRLGIQLAKIKWPEIEATCGQNDGGEDGTSFFIGIDGLRRCCACSLTGTFSKINEDASTLKTRNLQLDVLVFITPKVVSNRKISEWRKEIKKEFGHDLHVIPQSEIIAMLEHPNNAWLCREYLNLNFSDEPNLADLEIKARKAASELLKGWMILYQYEQSKTIELSLIEDLSKSKRLDAPKTQIKQLSLKDVAIKISQGNRVLLIGEPGAGKTFTLIQLADLILKNPEAPIPFLVSLPAWAESGNDFLSYLDQQFASFGLDTGHFNKLSTSTRIILLLNGWNEVADDFICQATQQLRNFVINKPAISLVLSTRESRMPIPFSYTNSIYIKPLSLHQKKAIINKAELDNPLKLIYELETNLSLAEITNAPLFLSTVINLARNDEPLPNTRSEILEKFIERIERTSEHAAALNATCSVFHRNYLTYIAASMTQAGVTTQSLDELLVTVTKCSQGLQNEGYLSTVPQSPAIIDCLAKHHLLPLSQSLVPTYRFVHQQFQEWFAAEWLQSRLKSLAKDEKPEEVFSFQHDVLNHNRWQQPIAFLIERLKNNNKQHSIVKKLIGWAMQVDLLLASELAGLAGKAVWSLIHDELGSSLRKWYGQNSEHHRYCALAAMLATGASDFQDILWPLLESDNEQTRLHTYRTWQPFPLTSLGDDWRSRFNKWSELRRFEFVEEMRWRPTQEHINLVCDLIKSDDSINVKVACLNLLNEVEAYETLTQVTNSSVFKKWLETLSDKDLLQLPVKYLRPFIPRLKTLLSNTQMLSLRSELIGVLHALDDSDLLNLVKAEIELLTTKQETLYFSDWMSSIGSTPKQPNLTHYLIGYFRLIYEKEPEWAINWLANQLMQGQCWHEPFTSYLSKLPEVVLQKVAMTALDAKYGVNTIRERAVLLGCSGYLITAKILLAQYLASTAENKQMVNSSFDRKDALKTGIRELPIQLLVDVVIDKAQNISDFHQLRMLIDLIMPHSALDSKLRFQLSSEQKDSLRTIGFRLEQMKPTQLKDLSWFRAHLAVFIGEVGKPEDTKILKEWFQDERIHRVKKQNDWQIKFEKWKADGRTGVLEPRDAMVYWNWYQGAFVQLACPEAAAVFLELLGDPDFLGDASQGLVLLIENNSQETNFAHNPLNKIKYSEIYERQKTYPQNKLSGESAKYADAIWNAIQHFLPELQNGKTQFLRSQIITAIAALASLGDSRAIPLLLRFSTDNYSTWTIAEAFHALMLRGVILPGKEIAEALEAFITEHEKVSNNDNWYMVVRCLTILLFSNNPSFGIERIKRIPSNRLRNYYIREILILLGNCQASEASDLLLYFMNIPEIKNHSFDELVSALSESNNPQSQKGLIILLNELCSGELSGGYTITSLAKAIARIARTNVTFWTDIKLRCQKAISVHERDILSRVLYEIGDNDAALALCDLIHDEFPINHYMKQLVKEVLMYKVPLRGSAYRLKPKEIVDLRKRLIEIAHNDVSRKTSALELLVFILQCRLEYGFLTSEDIHPHINLLNQISIPWQLIS